MFTVKLVSNNTTIINESECVQLGRKGSLEYSAAIDLAKGNKANRPEMLIHMTDIVSTDDLVNEPKDSEVIVFERFDGKDTDVIGVLLDSNHDDNAVSYQFIYAGDELYIMNDKGATVETLR